MPTLGGKQIWADRFVCAGWRIQENVVTRHCRLLDPRNVRRAWGSYAVCRAAFDRLRVPLAIVPTGDHLVVMLHGIFRAAEGFLPMARALSREGYEVAAITYPSTRRSIEEHAAQVTEILDAAEDVRTVSFVGHSMGGIVARRVLARDGAWKARIAVHRLVTIGTPNRGAELADALAAWWSFRTLAGPAGLDLTTSQAPSVPLPSCRFGIVAGARGDGRGWNPLLPGDDDMTVSLQSAQLEGAEDTLIVPGMHTFLMRRPDVIEGVSRYLRTGRFR